MAEELSVLARLMAVLAERRSAMPEGSYTTRLLAGGAEKIGEKILEEAQEVVEAAHEDGLAGQQHLIHEAADLVFHLFVMLTLRGITLDQLEAELERRFGTSGLAEKAARKPSPESRND